MSGKAIALKGMTQNRTGSSITGRDAELAVLLDGIEEDRPIVTFVHGVAGIGKSRLLAAFAERARATGATVLCLDCRTIEPTPTGFVRAASEAAGSSENLDALVARLSSIESRVVITLDTYELFRALDAWLRRDFLPHLDNSVRVVMASREPPGSRWLTTPEWRDEFHQVRLDPLDEPDAHALLLELGVSSRSATRMNAVAKGHPLALTMAARLQETRSDLGPEDIAAQSVVDYLAKEFLDEARDAVTREALEASSVVRRTTEPLLRAMLPHRSPRDAFDRLRSLSFVEVVRDGLLIHDSVRDSVATALKAADPERYRELKVAAWRELRTELKHAPANDLWRYTADLLYLLETPALRENFFPSGHDPSSIEPAESEDELAFRAIVEKHDGPQAAQALMAWWEFNPSSIKIVRGREGEIAGICVAMPSMDVDDRVAKYDPIAAAWLEDLHVKRNRGAGMLFRRWLDLDLGDSFGTGTMGAAYLEVKRQYIEIRPALRYCYGAATQWNPSATEPFFLQPFAPGTMTLDGRRYESVSLDMGPGSVEGWLTRVIAAELGIDADEDERAVLDAGARELVLADRRVDLTPLEFGVVSYLHDHPGVAVSRADLLEHVWGYERDATSNVVDTVVFGLRRKLGDRAGLIETARGAGYRYRE